MVGDNMQLLPWHGEPSVMDRLALKQESRPTGVGILYVWEGHTAMTF